MDISSVRTPARISREFVKISDDRVSRSEFDALHRRIEALEMKDAPLKGQVSTGAKVTMRDNREAEREALRARQEQNRMRERERIAALRNSSSSSVGDLKTTATGREIREISDDEFERIAAAHLAEARAELRRNEKNGERTGDSSLGVTSTGKNVRTVRSIPLDSDVHREKMNRDRDYMRMKSTGSKVVRQRDEVEEDETCDC